MANANDKWTRPTVIIAAVGLVFTLVAGGALAGVFGWVTQDKFNSHVREKNAEYRELRSAQEETARRLEKVDVNIEWIKREITRDNGDR